MDKNADAPPLWGLNTASPEMGRRTRKYFGRVYPELFAEEETAAAEKKRRNRTRTE